MNAQRRAKYHLTVCPGQNLQGPTDREIRDAVASRPGGVPSFLILTKAKHHFMQAGGSPKEGFTLEYQEHSVDGHWEHQASGTLDSQTVMRALMLYAADDDHWRTEFPWKRVVVRDTNTARARQETNEIMTAALKVGGFLWGLFGGKRK
jgi:hypothetical protein